MSHGIIESIGLEEWMMTPPGQYLMAWEKKQFDRTVADIFGFHAIQLGLSSFEGLDTNRMPYKWTAKVFENKEHSQLPQILDEKNGSSKVAHPKKYSIILDSRALPFPDQSIDLILLPHTLEISPDPHATLREVERVLVPEGRVVISGLNPVSLWGFCQKRVNAYRGLGLDSSFLPQEGDVIGYWRLRDWLKLLSFEVEGGRFGAYRPAFKTETWLNRFAWMDSAGDRWWPILGSVYFLLAVKRVRGMKMVGPVWKRPHARARSAVASVNSSSANKVENFLGASED